MSAILNYDADPTMLAEAKADHFRSMYEKTVENISTLFNPQLDRNINTSHYAIEYSVPGGKQTAVVSGDLLKQEINRVIESVEDDSIEDLDETLNLIDEQGESIKVSMTDVLASMNNMADSLQITYLAYSSLVQGFEGAAQRLADRFSIAVINKKESITSLVSSLYDTISQSSSINQALISLDNFLGYKQAVEDPEVAILSDDIGLQNYTGVNPLVAWFNGIDINFEFIPSIIYAVIKASAQVVFSVLRGVSSLIGKVFKSVTGYVKHTFVDPIDYEVDGSVVNYSTIPSKVTFDYDRNPLDPNLLDVMMNDLGVNVLWFKHGPSIFRVARVTNATGDGGKFYCERYIKPTDPTLLKQVLDRNLTKVLPNGTRQASSLKDIYNLFSEMSDNELSPDPKTSELNMYYSILVSLFLQFMTTDMANAWSNVLWQAINGSDPQLASGNINLDILVEDSPLLGSSFSLLNTNLNLLYGLLHNYTEDTVLDSYKNLMMGDLDLFDPYKTTVTNLDFLRAVTTIPTGKTINPDFSIDALTIGVNNGYENSYFKFNQSYPNEMPRFVYPLAGCYYYTKRFNDHFFSDNEVVEPVMAYSKIVDYPFKANLKVKTDKENISAVSNFLVGALVIAGVVIVGVLAFKAAKAFSAYSLALSTSTATLEREYGNAIVKGEATEAMYKTLKKSKKLNNLINGASTASAFSVVSLSDSLSSSKNSIDDIMRVLR